VRGRELQDYLDLSAEELARLEEKKDSGYGSQGLIRVALKVFLRIPVDLLLMG
jgi:hypothetical protein